MRASLLALFTALLAACPSPGPVAPKGDASDASALGPPSPVVDGGFSGPCADACSAMVTAGCIVRADCPLVLSAKTSSRQIRNPQTGLALTCEDVAKVKTAADVQALGQACGP